MNEKLGGEFKSEETEDFLIIFANDILFLL